MSRITSRVAKTSRFSGGVIPLARRRRMSNQQLHMSNSDKKETSLLLNGQELVDKLSNTQGARSIPNRSKWFHLNRIQEESTGESDF